MVLRDGQADRVAQLRGLDGRGAQDRPAHPGPRGGKLDVGISWYELQN